MELYIEFAEACRSGALADVAELVDAEPRSPEYLTEGLTAAAFANNDCRVSPEQRRPNRSGCPHGSGTGEVPTHIPNSTGAWMGHQRFRYSE